MSTIIIQGSSRSEGNSFQISNIVQKYTSASFIDLKKKHISSYCYTHVYIDDDFLNTMREIIQYDTMVFITPVYWYAMSGIMKNFFDRITDCLMIEKEIGYSLKGKNMMAISCGSEETETSGFFIPFQNSAEYLGMNYLGNLHTWVNDTSPNDLVKQQLKDFLISNIPNSQQPKPKPKTNN